MKWGTSLHDLL